MKAASWVLCAGVAFALATGASATTFSTIYAFGDSLSDAGNFYIYSSNPANGQTPASVAPYWEHEFSNGRVDVQALSYQLGDGTLVASLKGGTDYAYSGSHSGTTLVTAAGPTDLPAQFSQFEAGTPGGAPAGALYTIQTGANDIIGAINRYTSKKLTLAQTYQVMAEAAQNVATFASELHTDGGENLLVYEAPDMGLTPDFNAGPDAALATSLSATFNSDLLADLAPIESSGLTVYALDVFAIEDAMVAKPAYYGLTNVTTPCWTGTATSSSSGVECGSPATTMFWDVVHTTAAVDWTLGTDARELLAASAPKALIATPDFMSAVPEPVSWSVMVAGMFVVGGALRARSKRYSLPVGANRKPRRAGLRTERVQAAIEGAARGREIRSGDTWREHRRAPG